MAWENIVIESVEEIRANNYLALLMNEIKENARTSETYERWVDSLDNGINEIELSFFNIMQEIGRLTGITTLRLKVARILECSCTRETTRADLFRMAKEIRVIVDEEIECLESCFDPESADILRKAFHEGKIVETFIEAITWIADEAARRITWGNVSKEQILGVVCRNIGRTAHFVQQGEPQGKLETIMRRIEENMEKQSLKSFLSKQMSWESMRQQRIR